MSAASGGFNRASRPSPDELDLSRILELAASVPRDGDESLLQFSVGDYTVPSHGAESAAVGGGGGTGRA